MVAEVNVLPKIKWHHGSCDYCGRKQTLICNLGYDSQPKNYKICLDCMGRNINTILFGWMEYRVDKTIDRLSEEDR